MTRVTANEIIYNLIFNHFSPFFYSIIVPLRVFVRTFAIIISLL